jgi:ATP-dependent exoDNAse (exonuclease V) beta subunit
MDATVAAIEARGEAGAFETLPYSWRSRAPLVRLTSGVFAPAFEAQGIPATRVRLEPSPRTADPDALGHSVEVWRLQTKRKDDDAAAVAAGVVQLLDDADARIRDVMTGVARRVQPSDIAVLCRRNRDARRMAAALESLGVPAVLGRPGLAATLEGRVVLAALRLWVDRADTLAAAELGRILSLPTQGDAWLQQVLDTDGRPFQSLTEVAAVSAARAEATTAGVMAAFDAAVHAVGARELCLRWGSSAQRLANLDRLRALAVRYTHECTAERETPTVAGLVAHLGLLQAEEKDEQATPSGQQAVTVSTLHGAKGLEWPVTVMFAIDRSREPSAFDVHVMQTGAPFSFEQPLAGRWIRYWPDPFAARPGPYGASSPSRGSTSLHAAVAGSLEQQLVQAREARENLRLLYVGWTRARDRVVLASREGKLLESGFDAISGEGGLLLLREPDADGMTAWADQALEVRVRSTGVTEGVPMAVDPGEGYVPAGPRDYAPATVNPSLLRRVGVLGAPDPLGEGVVVLTPAKGTAIGDACHAFFAADLPIAETERMALAERLLLAHGAQPAIRAEELVRAGTALRAWCERRWPGATLRREWPVRHRLDDGSELNGYIDMLLETKDGLVVIDHKCLAGDRDGALDSAAHYHGQLEAYANALTAATGQPVIERWLHLVLQGLMVRAG